MLADFAFYIAQPRTALVRIILAQKIQLNEFKRKQGRIRARPETRVALVLLLKGIKNWRNCLYIVSAATFRDWIKSGILRLWNLKNRIISVWRKWRGLEKRRGPKYKYADLLAVIQKIKTANPEYGIDRIHGKLRFLDFHIARSRLAEILRREFPERRPRPGQRDSWKQIFCGLTPDTWAMDFFVQLDCFVRPQYSFVVQNLARRDIIHFASTYHPTGPWVAQQLRFAFRAHGAPRTLISDGDAIFKSATIRKILEKHHVARKQTAPRAPWQNGVVERLIGTLRREVFDRVLIFTSAQSERIMKEYIPYYNQRRPHLRLGEDAPAGRPIETRPGPDAEIRANPILNGLEHDYTWEDDAA